MSGDRIFLLNWFLSLDLCTQIIAWWDVKTNRALADQIWLTVNSSNNARASGSIPNSSANILCTGYMSCLKRIPSSTGYAIDAKSWIFSIRFGDRRYLFKENNDNDDVNDVNDVNKAKFSHSSMPATTRSTTSGLSRACLETNTFCLKKDSAVVGSEAAVKRLNALNTSNPPLSHLIASLLE